MFVILFVTRELSTSDQRVALRRLSKVVDRTW
jgi:hypothetical protein